MQITAIIAHEWLPARRSRNADAIFHRSDPVRQRRVTPVQVRKVVCEARSGLPAHAGAVWPVCLHPGAMRRPQQRQSGARNPLGADSADAREIAGTVATAPIVWVV